MSSNVRRGLLVGSNAWLLLGLGCLHASPAPEALVVPAIPQIAIPPGCEADLTGAYVLASSPAYHYRAADDGSALSLAVERGPPGCSSVALWRTAHGFVGRAFGGYASDAGWTCAATFPTEVVACTDAGLTLRSAATVSLTPQCLPVDASAPALTEYALTRAAESIGPNAPLDGGTADAGEWDAGLSSPPPPV